MREPPSTFQYLIFFLSIYFWKFQTWREIENWRISNVILTNVHSDWTTINTLLYNLLNLFLHVLKKCLGRISVYSPGWPWSPKIPVSAFPVLGLQFHTWLFFLLFLYFFSLLKEVFKNNFYISLPLIVYLYLLRITFSYITIML